jgi:serine/threonine protein kinase
MHNLLALPAGTELVEDYRIMRVLGAGGFGLTYLAREETLDRSVTIKEYFPSDFAAREATLSVRPRSVDAEADYGWGLERFIEEAQTLARFDHPNINRVYRYFRANNTAYMVLHFEEGQSFKSWLNGLGRAPRQAELDAIAGPLLDALEMIHAGNFLHRDIAPDNIIIRKTGAPVLIDFGSARGEMVQLSKTVSALVKPGYSPYEQYGLSGRQQGPWTDIYSLGASLYQAIAGKRPTDAPTRMVADDYRPAASVALSSYRPQFLAAIDHALKLRVEDRPQTIAAWRRALMPPQADAPARSAGVILAAPAPEPPAPLAKIPNIFKRTPADPAAASAPSHQKPGTSLKKRLVRLLEGVAARPAGKSDAPPVSAPVAAPADAAPPVATKSAATKSAAAAPIAVAPPAPVRALSVATVKPTPAPPKPPPLAKASPLAKVPKKAAPEAPALRPAERLPAVKQRVPASASPARRGSRGLAVKLLAGAVASAVLLSYQDQIAARWHAFKWPPVLSLLATDGRSGARPPTEKKVEPRKAEVRAAPVAASAPNPEPVPVPRRVEETVLKGHKGAVHAVTFVAGSLSLASTGADGTLRLWDAAKGELIRTVEAGDNVTGALSVQERIAAVGHQDGMVSIWDLDRGQRQRTFKRNDALIWSVAFAGDTQRVLSAGHDWAVALWDQRRDAGPAHLFEGHDNAVQAVAFGSRPSSQGGSLLATGSADKTIRLWDAADFGQIRIYRGHRDFVSALAFAPDGGHFASASFDKTVKLWSTSESGSSRTLRGHKGRVTAVAFSPDGQILASASEDGTVRLWDWKRSRVVRTLAGHTGGVRAVAFSADGKYAATAGEDGSIRLWDAATLPKSTASRT